MKLLQATDVHLGVAGVPTQQIYDGFEQTVYSQPKFRDVDALVFTGDVYDEALDHAGEEAVISQRFIHRTLTWCKENDVVCIVLEGTPSHDRRQSRWFTEINQLANIGATLYYFDKLTVKYIPELKKTFLAVPDEIAKPRIKADGMIKALLKEKNLSQVDVSLTHGYFDFHLPKHEIEQGHSSSYFKKITKWVTLNGHIHTPSHRHGVLTGGSTGRYRHGEEEKKGFHLIELMSDGNYQVEFIENRVLTPFKTIDVKGYKSDKVVNKVTKTTKDWTNGNLRLHYKRGDVAHDLLNYLKDKFPNIVFSTKVDKLELEVKEELKDINVKISAVSINRENTPGLLREGLLKATNDPARVEQVMKTFMEHQPLH